MFSRHLRQTRRASFALGLAALAGLLLLPGCHQATDEDAGLSLPSGLRSTPDRPAALPPPPVLFAAVMAPMPPPARQVARAPVPPRPADPSLVARQATLPDAAPAQPLPANPGLIVCDPLPGSPALAVLGRACGRWLDLTAAGQPELGRTPLWESRERARQEMKRADFALTPAQAVALAGITGVTHAACGTLTGTPARCTLTYGLYAVPSGKPLGPMLVQTGTEPQVVAALPGMARALDVRLGVPAPRVPASVGLSAAELTQAETIAEEETISDADLLTLSRLSARCPLVGMYYVGTRAADDQILLIGMVKTLLRQLPGNTLALSHVGYAQAQALRPYAASTRAWIARYPVSALLAHTEIWEQRVWGTRAGEWNAALRICRDAPGDPEAWLSRSYTLIDIAQDLRQGRFANDLSPADWAVLGRLYAQQEQTALQATALDPKDGHAWLRLAQAATFAGDSFHREGAFQQALALDPNKAEVYAWGLQMYQPKWYDDAASLSHIAALAAAVPWDEVGNATSMAEALDGAGFHTEAAQVLPGYIARQRVLVAKSPASAIAHWNLAAALAAQKTSPSLREASLEYRTAEHLMPNAPAIHHWLGDVLDQRGHTSEAVAEYRKAILLDPFDAAVHYDLGFDLKHQSRFPEALTELRLAMRLNPRSADAHSGIGDLLNMQHQYGPAAAEYREAIRMAYYSPGAWLGLPTMLDECGRYDEAIRAGQEADHVFKELRQTDGEEEPALHDTIADVFLRRKDWANSIAESNTTLGYNPRDACAHENLAEAYLGQGRKDAARAEWRQAVSLGDPQITPVAQKFLAANP